MGHPARENNLEKSEQKSQCDIQEEEKVKGGVISDIVSDFKDFSSLKRKKSKGKETKESAELTKQPSNVEPSVEENGH